MSDSLPFSAQEMRSRLAAIRAHVHASGLQALITQNQANIRYATGFRGEPGTLLLTQDTALLFTSFRTLPWAQKQTQVLASELELSIDPPFPEILKRLAEPKLPIGVDQTLSHLRFLDLKRHFPPYHLQTCSSIEQTRRCKSPAEIELLAQSQQLNEEIFQAVLPRIQLGMSERVVQGLILTELAQRPEVDAASFAPIVATGGNTWEIHHLPDESEIRNNNLLLLDLGVIYRGYASDMTRTIALGTPSSEMREVYETVGQAQEAAIAAMKPGDQTHAIDSAARKIIGATAQARSFTHGLGHSIGLETHDPGLNLSPYSPDEVLLPGMAFTVEPGIYLADGAEPGFGVRTEDVVVVTAEGNRNLTKQSKDLFELSL